MNILFFWNSSNRDFISFFISLFSFTFLLYPPLPCALSEILGPAGVIKNFNSTLIDAMKKADELGYEGRYKLLDPVIKNSFALPFMAARSVGRYEKTLSHEERDTLAKEYTDWTVATYAGRFDDYSGQRFEVVSESGPVEGTVSVTSKLLKKNGEEIVFVYLLRKINGRWRVVDIQISGVSQLALTRAQFTMVMKDKGFKGLMSMLKEKITGFEKAAKKSMR
jgi:phospholipid transport system substrate-binding protein